MYLIDLQHDVVDIYNNNCNCKNNKNNNNKNKTPIKPHSLHQICNLQPFYKSDSIISSEKA